MATIAWNTSDFHVLTAFPKCTEFNTQYYSDEIRERIREWRQAQGTEKIRKLRIYEDNARPHPAMPSLEFLDANGMKKTTPTAFPGFGSD
jgi:hypothetical protein